MKKKLSIPEFYDLVGHRWLEKDEGDRTPKELAIIKKQFPSPVYLIEAGCGYGRIAIPLANLGYQVYAFDSSFQMLQELCNRCACELTNRDNLMISKEDLQRPKDLPKNVAGVLLMWETFTNIEKNKQLKALMLYKKAMKKNGKILIELPDIDKQAYAETTKAKIKITRQIKNYGLVLDYWDKENAISLSIPNAEGMAQLASRAKLKILKSYRFKVAGKKGLEKRMVYVLQNH